MDLKLVSPHRDDAAFSCGIFLSVCADANIKVQVVNTFTYSDYAPFAEPSTADRVSTLRKGEDESLRTRLGSSLCFLDIGLKDAPLRLQIHSEQTLMDSLDPSAYLREVEGLEKAFQPIFKDAACVLVPMAIGGHIDHRVARDTTMRCVPFENLAFYEDLPYVARTDGEQRVRILGDLEHVGKLHAITVRRSNGAAVKEALASCYGSQVASSTVAEMASYAAGHNGGETFYAGENAARLLDRIVHFGNKGPSSS